MVGGRRVSQLFLGFIYRQGHDTARITVVFHHFHPLARVRELSLSCLELSRSFSVRETREICRDAFSRCKEKEEGEKRKKKGKKGKQGKVKAPATRRKCREREGER